MYDIVDELTYTNDKLMAIERLCGNCKSVSYCNTVLYFQLGMQRDILKTLKKQSETIKYCTSYANDLFECKKRHAASFTTAIIMSTFKPFLLPRLLIAQINFWRAMPGDDMILAGILVDKDYRSAKLDMIKKCEKNIKSTEQIIEDIGVKLSSKNDFMLNKKTYIDDVVNKITCDGYRIQARIGQILEFEKLLLNQIRLDRKIISGKY